MLQRLINWITGESAHVASVNAQFSAMDAMAARFAESCPICNGTDVFLCPDCRQPIKTHSHENDYMCDCWTKEDAETALDSSVRPGGLRDVNPIRQSDGARISGDGRPGPLRVLTDRKVKQHEW